MLNAQNQGSATPPLFALRMFENATVEGRQSLGNPDQDWTWAPIGDLKPEQLEIYATNGNSTTKQTYAGQWDSGEYN